MGRGTRFCLNRVLFFFSSTIGVKKVIIVKTYCHYGGKKEKTLSILGPIRNVELCAVFLRCWLKWY